MNMVRMTQFSCSLVVKNLSDEDYLALLQRCMAVARPYGQKEKELNLNMNSVISGGKMSLNIQINGRCVMDATMQAALQELLVHAPAVRVEVQRGSPALADVKEIHTRATAEWLVVQGLLANENYRITWPSLSSQTGTPHLQLVNTG